jgi:(E)-4-hydroxy-3-methylbut-2-enyl-diphosphate synthase
MVYAAGRTDHTIGPDGMIDHIVDLVEAKAAAIRAAEPAPLAAAAAE